MYKNKCTKCGVEFETKNPKRVICPGCLYPDRKDLSLDSYNNTLNQPKPEEQQSAPVKEDKNFKQKSPGYYVVRDNQDQQQERRPDYNNQYNQRPPRPQGGYNRDGYNRDGNRDYNNRGGDYNRSGGGNYNSGGGSSSGSFRRPQQPYNQQRPGGDYNRSGGGNYNSGGGNYSGGGFRRPPQQQQYGGQRKPFQRDSRGGPRRPPMADKKLLISREQVAEIEKLYMAMLPLPNPDCHEVIGEKIGLESNKVFFGINLVRQKIKLPKLPFPKRKLAISLDQLTAIKNLYTPLLPLPPIGCHKFLAKQLKMDEWRVHVGIGIIRKQMNLPRWNPDRDDAPAEFKNAAKEKETDSEKK